MAKTLVAYFTESVAPKTGLSATIDIWRVSDSVKVVTAQAMTEIAGGWYKYVYSGADSNEDYVSNCDAGTDTVDQRVVPGATESQDAEVEITAIQTQTDKMNFVGDDMKATLDSEEVDIGAVKGTGVTDVDDFKADVSSLATESQATTNKGEIIANDDSNTTTIVGEVNANETKLDSIITTLSTLIADVWGYVTRTLTGSVSISGEVDVGSVKGSPVTGVDDFKADVSSLATEANATTNKNEVIAEVDENESKLDSIYSALAGAPAAIWAFVTRTLTSGTKDSEIDQIVAKLPSKSHIAGTNNSDGDIELNEATGALSPDAVNSVLDEVVEGSLTFREALRIFLSVLSGKTSGGETSTLTYRDIGDTKDRLVVEVDSERNRVNVSVRDGS